MVQKAEAFATIVSGLPRSGTSMMMMMLEAGGLPVLTDQVRTADQENPKGYYEYEPVKKTRADASWASEALGKAVKVVHLLMYDLPKDHRYRVVLMRRNLDEVLASQQSMLAAQGQRGADMSDNRLAKIFDKQMETLVAWLARQSNFEVLEISYNQVIKEPHSFAEKIRAFLGDTLDVDAMTTAVDPSLHRQRR